MNATEFVSAVRAALAQVDGGPVFVPTGPTLQDSGDANTVIDRTVTPPVFSADYWVKGQLGAMKGANAQMWSEGNQMHTMMGDPTPETTVMIVAPDAQHWNDACKSAWDIGWLSPRPAVPTDPGWATLYAGRQ